jgi:predicted RNA-binding protein YlqC (UPF0109 family)
MTHDPSDIAKLAYTIAALYVDDPQRLRVTGTRHGDRFIVRFPGHHLKVDHGRLIGGTGKNYRALKRILQEAVGGKTLDLEIIDPTGKYQVGGPVPADPNWDKDELFREMLAMILEQVFGWHVPVLVEEQHETGTGDRSVFLIEHGGMDPEVLASFQILWKAIGRHHGRNFILKAEAPKAVANG